MFNRRLLCAITALLCVSVVLTGCEPLRKKFTRKKKASQIENDKFIPVLEPQEYPTPEENPEENYKQHYAMVRVFHKDLMTSVQEKARVKRSSYAYNQVMDHLNQMKSLLIEEKKGEIEKLERILDYYKQTLEESPHSRNVARLNSDLRAFYHQLLTKCKADKMRGSFIPAVKNEK